MIPSKEDPVNETWRHELFDVMAAADLDSRLRPYLEAVVADVMVFAPEPILMRRVVWFVLMAGVRQSDAAARALATEMRNRTGVLPLVPPLDQETRQAVKSLPDDLAAQPVLLKAMQRHAGLLAGLDEMQAVNGLCHDAALL